MLVEEELLLDELEDELLPLGESSPLLELCPAELELLELLAEEDEDEEFPLPGGVGALPGGACGVTSTSPGASGPELTPLRTGASTLLSTGSTIS